ncbi:MAG TPA: cytochrome c biogenesis protein CcdA [Candidatus Aminicenantes bacterium]|nr:cytochrome c biogenesis protein CcdA [Candidatus Aminicenantes bacterium]HRY63918.1 cytochrome c biogenesis protein CcdA [Candidatus Aminicenantes bacterium]HRZ70831.1 cytochrome c biogenesis protein CcdA [Candidatus Aminicenantes bacterium]
MDRLFGDISALLQSNPWLAIAAVFLGGVTTALNPCVLAMVPLLMGVVAGSRETTTLRRSLVFSLFFVLGLAVTFTALGLISALMGRMFGNVGSFWKYLVAAVCLVMGLQLLGLLKLSFPVPAGLEVKKRGYIGAFLLGLLFGVVSTPCAVPILAVLLAFVAEKGNVLYGGFLLFIYALGHSALVLAAGTSVGAAKSLLESKGLRTAHGVLQKIAGVLIVGIGAYFLFGM